jgi:hypothetical protein
MLGQERQNGTLPRPEKDAVAEAPPWEPERRGGRQDPNAGWVLRSYSTSAGQVPRSHHPGGARQRLIWDHDHVPGWNNALRPIDCVGRPPRSMS